jgi:hypothetical protein
LQQDKPAQRGDHGDGDTFERPAVADEARRERWEPVLCRRIEPEQPLQRPEHDDHR